MTSSKSTKRALVSSALAILACVAMLIGTTFAWFTDTASTGVNKIVSGNLKVDIIGENSDSHISTLNFQKAAGAQGEQILWEPGCRYLTEGFRIANNGNLALKWKAEINKDNIVNGKVVDTAKDGVSLLDVIDFYVVTKADDGTETAVAIENFTGKLAANVGKSETYYIKGVMQTAAGNDYQDLTLEGITITVYATQDTVEHDSFGNQYDASADMTPDNLDMMTVDGVAIGDLTSAVKAASEGSTITFRKSTTEPMKLVLSEPMTLKGITFQAAPGVEIKGLQLISAKSATRLELEDITFKNITFTDAVKLGQNTILYGPSKCSNITFENCKFDLTDSKDAATSRFAIKRASAKGADESIAYTNGLTVKNCDFSNVASGIFVSMMRDVTVENCTFTNCKSAAIRFGDVAGNVNIIGNTISNAKGVLSIANVANNSTTTDTQTNTVIKDNTATSMTCNNGEVFMAAYDNGKTSGKSTYTITGNSCIYATEYPAPLNGFKIVKTYGPSVAEFIPNT